MLWRKSCNFAAILLLCSVQIVLILAENYPQYKSSNVNNELIATKEEVSEGEGRFLASLYFPFLPQYENVNYGKILKFLTAPTTVAAFLGRHVISVRHTNPAFFTWKIDFTSKRGCLVNDYVVHYDSKHFKSHDSQTHPISPRPLEPCCFGYSCIRYSGTERLRQQMTCHFHLAWLEFYLTIHR